MLHIGFVGRRPWSHALNWFQSHGAKPAKLATFVATKLVDISNEFNWLLSDDAQRHAKGWTDVWGALAETEHEDASSWTAFIVSFVLSGAAEYHWRFLLVCNRFPIRLLCFSCSFKPHNEPCELRKAAAGAILAATTPDDLDNDCATWKLKHILHHAWPDIAKTGKLQVDIANLFDDIADMWMCDTQELASVNSIIRILTERARNIALKLISSRLTARKFLVM